MQDKTIKQRCLSFWLATTVSLRFHLVTLLILCLSSVILTVGSHADELDQATLKVLYTYKFGKFTQWPDNRLNTTNQHFQYCILGENPFSQKTLNMIIGKSVQGLPLAVEVFDSGLVPQEVLEKCHLVFVSTSEKHRLATILSSLKKLPVLSISDITGFSAQGGMITLIESEGKLHFQINPDALQHAHISMSSKIMELADIVDKEQR